MDKVQVTKLKELASLNLSAEQVRAFFHKDNFAQRKSDAEYLDLNLGDMAVMVSEKKDVDVLGELLNESGIVMRQSPYGTQSSTIADLGAPGSREDMLAMSRFQQEIAWHMTTPENKRSAATVSDLTSGGAFNLYTELDVLNVSPVIDRLPPQSLLADSVPTTGTSARIPYFSNAVVDREARRVTEMGQIPVSQFSTGSGTVDLYKLGRGMQWSREAQILEMSMDLVRLHLRSIIAQMQIDRRYLIIEEMLSFARASDTAKFQSARSHSITGTLNVSAWRSMLRTRWKEGFTPNLIITNDAGAAKLDALTFVEQNGTDRDERPMSDAERGASGVPRYVRNIDGIEYINLDDNGKNITDGTNAIDDTHVIIADTNNAMASFYNPGLTSDATEEIQGNQSYIRRFTFAELPFGLYQKALDYVEIP